VKDSLSLSLSSLSCDAAVAHRALLAPSSRPCRLAEPRLCSSPERRQRSVFATTAASSPASTFFPSPCGEQYLPNISCLLHTP
jgi:hypothetical protein